MTNAPAVACRLTAALYSSTQGTELPDRMQPHLLTSRVESGCAHWRLTLFANGGGRAQSSFP
jgi:hypothetical protein